MQTLTELPPLSLYIHLPWCEAKCPYCDFNSYALHGQLQEQLYLDALLTDLEHDLPQIQSRQINSIFFGGGTPSLFSPRALDKLLTGIRCRLKLSQACEITLEANPSSVEQQKFAEFYSLGINRLSLGIQSFNNQYLTRLGRVHSAEQGLAAIEAAWSAGFENFNLDLMFGLPGQSINDAMADLTQAIELSPPHISWYQLTIEPNTKYAKHPPQLPEDDILESVQRAGHTLLEKHTYQQYEISAFAKSGHSCAHNLNYWNFGDYLGLGAGAHAKITNLSTNRICRYSKLKQPKLYLARAGFGPQTDQRELTIEELPLEFFMNTLRLNQGIAKPQFTARTGLPVTGIQNNIDTAVARGLMVDSSRTFQATNLGRRFLNDLLQLFMPAKTAA